MLWKECPYCHKPVLKLRFARHVAQHTKLRDDGQMTDHVTAAEKERYTGSLEGIPTGYYHPKCGAGTRMPEEIIRSDLGNPYWNDTEHSFCCGCGTYVHMSELFWIGTDESLLAAKQRLRREYDARRQQR
ncbi:MAG: hypothetical protein R3B90_13460 [Planctomycetaceae bacterium]